MYAAIPEGGSSSSTGSSAPTMQTAGSIEFVGILKVTMISGKSLSGPKAPPDLQLQSAPHICVGLGTQVFKTKPAKGRDKNNPVFQEVRICNLHEISCRDMNVVKCIVNVNCFMLK